MGIINLKLMGNPLNWATLALWLFAAGLFLTGSGLTKATPPAKNLAP